MRSPSSESIAGRTVTEPATETSTTRIAAIAKPSKISIPERNMPDMATTTVTPEIRTDRPEVAAAMRSAVAGSRPRTRSSRTRRR